MLLSEVFQENQNQPSGQFMYVLMMKQQTYGNQSESVPIACSNNIQKLERYMNKLKSRVPPVNNGEDEDFRENEFYIANNKVRCM
jgi:hypothetical protein